MKDRAAILLLTAALLASAALILSLDSQLTFVGDGWELLVNRQGWSASTFLDPFNEHMVLGPALVYKLLLAIFGMGSALPFYTVSISLFLLGAVLLFVYLRSRLGDWLALIGAVLVLFLGAASEDLLWEFQMGFFGSIAAGLGMLLALDREDRSGDRTACGLLVVSLAFSSAGIAFAAAGLADLALGRRPRLRRAYVTLLPLAAYALWRLGWAHAAASHLSFQNLEHLPRYIFDAAAAGLASVLGREPLAPDGHPPVICEALLVVVLVVAAFRIGRERHMSRGLVIALALALAFWTLTGLDRTPDRYATSSRYQYPSVVFLLLIAAEMLRGTRISRLAVGATAVIAAGGVFGGVSLMHRQYTRIWKPMADQVRVTLAAVEIAGERARPNFPIMFPPSTVVPARAYLRTRRDHGSPAFDEAELLARPEPEREIADRTLAGALGMALVPPSHKKRAWRCQILPPARTGEVKLHSGAFTLTNTGQAGAKLWLGRFSLGFPVELGHLPPRAARSVSIPVDGSPRPWTLVATGDSVRVCTMHRPPRSSLRQRVLGSVGA